MRGGTSLSADEPHERSGIRDITPDLRNNFSRPRNERGPPRSGSGRIIHSWESHRV